MDPSGIRTLLFDSPTCRRRSPGFVHEPVARPLVVCDHVRCVNCPRCQRDLPSPPGKVCIHCGLVLATAAPAARIGAPAREAAPGGAAAASAAPSGGAGPKQRPPAARQAPTPGPATGGTAAPGASHGASTGSAAGSATSPRTNGPGRPKPASRLQRDPLVGTEIAGRFLVEELIGQGGMGKVYKARHLALEKTVCLKTLKPALLEDPTLVGRFEREAKASSRLNHPNVIAVLDFGRIGDEGTLYIAMEFVQGRDLRLVLRDEWPLGEDRLVHIMAQVLGALAEAHTHNVVHRDLKPENIMIEQRRDSPDFVKVLDFGIAKIMDADSPGLTRSDVVCGTPQYMAPEQATGSALDARCDLYAVGVILYQLATGHLPFDGQNSMEVLTKHVNEAPVPPRQRQPDAPISAAMEKLILHALEKEPSARPQTAEEFRRLLLAIPQRAQSAPTAEHGSALPAPTQLLPPLPPPRLGVADPAPQAVKKGAASAGAVTEPARAGGKRPLIIGATAAAVLAIAAAVAMGLAKPSVTAPLPGAAQAAATPSATKPGATTPGAANPGAATPAAATPAEGVAAAAAKVARDPAKAATLVEEASRLQRDGDTGAARDLLEQAVVLDPGNAAIHFRLGTLYSGTKPQRAREEYQAAIRLDEAKYGEQARMMMQALQ